MPKREITRAEYGFKWGSELGYSAETWIPMRVHVPVSSPFPPDLLRLPPHLVTLDAIGTLRQLQFTRAAVRSLLSSVRGFGSINF